MPFKIRDYVVGDCEYIFENPSTWCNTKKWFFQYIDNLNKVVLCNNKEKAVAVLLWFEYSKEKAHAGIIASKEFDSKAALVLREAIPVLMKKNGFNRLETDSEDNDKLNKYHLFLGFAKEGTKRHYVGNTDYNVWSIVNGS